MGMGKSSNRQQQADGGARCRRHARHRQAAAGVCAFCLRERLSHLSLSSSLPSVVRGDDYEDAERERASSSCSEASTAAYSSEGSSGCSSAAGAGSGGAASPGFFHDEVTRMRRTGRVSLLMRHERVVGDADAVAAFLQARREQRRRTTTSFWAKLLHAATRGGGGAKRRQDDDGCSLAHAKTSSTLQLQERIAAAKWVLF